MRILKPVEIKITMISPMKKRGRKPSRNPLKSRTAITIDPALKTEIIERTGNISGFLEAAGRRELTRLSKRHPGDIPVSAWSGK